MKRNSSDESKALRRVEILEDLSGKDYESKSSSDKKSSGGPSKTIGFTIKENSNELNELNVRVETENDESANNIMYEDYDEADFINIDDENGNLVMKLDDNMLMAEDNYETNELNESTNLHASINQYKSRFLASVRFILK
jgi:hypothetical protein